jgi:hypothetical protein
MKKYLLIESRDPYGAADTDHVHDLAQRLAEAGDLVEIFLVQNGVLPARGGAGAEPLARLAARGIPVWADAFSLRERAIAPDRLAAGIQPAPLDLVIDRLGAGVRALWH